MKLRKPFSKGERVYIWWDTGALGAEQWCGTVIRVNRVTVTVQMDHREKPQRVNPEELHLVDWDESEDS